MRHLVYGSTPILVSDDVADAVIGYAAVIARRQLSDVVAIPTVDGCGLPAITQIMLAPGVPVLTEDAPDDELETPADGFVQDIARRQQQATSSS